jgi:hypothetical protein
VAELAVAELAVAELAVAEPVTIADIEAQPATRRLRSVSTRPVDE